MTPAQEMTTADAEPGARSRRVPLLLVVLGVAQLPLYLWAAIIGDLRAHPFAFAALYITLCALYAIACRLVISSAHWTSTRRPLATIVIAALVYRIVFVPVTPSLSDDFFRLVWDGYIQQHGYNPHHSPPLAAELAPLRDQYYWPRINRKEQTSAYPPFAELIFRTLALIQPLAALPFKIAFLLIDLTTIGLLILLLRQRGQSPALALIYAWHPLAPFEFIASAHIDVLAVMLLALALVLEARGRRVAAGIVLGLATLTKLYPGLLLPAFCRRGQWRLPLATGVTVIAGFLPSLISGDSNFRQLPTYLSEEGYGNGERFFLLQLVRLIMPMPTIVYIVAAGIALLALALWLWAGAAPRTVPQRALILATAIMVLVTPSYQWYFLWLLPFLVIAPWSGSLYLVGAIGIGYLYWNWPTTPPRWLSLTLVLAVIYLPAYFLLARAWRLGRNRSAARRNQRPLPHV